MMPGSPGRHDREEQQLRCGRHTRDRGSDSDFHAEGTGYPAIFNIEQDPREEMNIAATSGWVSGQYLRLIGEYQKSLEKYPNSTAVNLTQFGR